MLHQSPMWSPGTGLWKAEASDACHGFGEPMKWTIRTFFPNLKLIRNKNATHRTLNMFLLQQFNLLFVCWPIRIGAWSSHVVNERQSSTNIFCGPVCKVRVEQTLVTTWIIPMIVIKQLYCIFNNHSKYRQSFLRIQQKREVCCTSPTRV